MLPRASRGARNTARQTAARTLATLVALVLVFPSFARAESDGGVVLDAPRVLKLPNGHFDFNPAAFAKVDDELKRLQQLERVHKQEPSWATPLILGMVLGVVVAIPATWLASSAVNAAKPSP